ncbi:spore germination protein [Oceanobacillus damuensis]|uniref:spore germination protein n=1 Tax=Oceanobacillus damuensis TaxID=937928 RepID=UPI0008312C05|nr:spore germination protein [Oceanobacillus damuensis]
MARSFFSRKKKNKQSNQDTQQPKFSAKLKKSLDDNLENMKTMLGNPGDLVVRELMIGGLETRAAIMYINGLTDKNLINNNILKTIQLNLKQFESNVLDKIFEEVIAITDTKKANSMDEVSLALLNGGTAFYIDGMETVLLMGTSGGETRSIEEPDSETLIRGPRDGFVESIETNLALIRRDIKDPNLRFKQHEVGRRSKQKLVVSYVEGIVNPEIVEEIERRLKTIDVDIASDSAYVEQWIEDSFLSIFPQFLNTERPDKVSAVLLQGKVAILVEGTPFVLLAPISLGEALFSMEDYNQRWLSATLLRTLRYFSAFIAIFLPAIYIALVSYHPGMLPSTLVFSIAASREGVPFPAAIEAILMAVTFEILHEAGIRLPKVIGQTIGIVGGLVIGEAAVSAGIVSTLMVIVTALTAIATFSVPSYSVAITFRMLRFAFMIAASILGLYGIVLIYIMVNIHLVNLKSIGVPYVAPFAPIFVTDWKDLIFRAPVTKLTQRPAFLKTTDDQSKETKSN